MDRSPRVGEATAESVGVGRKRWRGAARFTSSFPTSPGTTNLLRPQVSSGLTRSTVEPSIVMSWHDWMRLRECFEATVHKLRINEDEELKWSYVQSVVQHRIKGEPIPGDLVRDSSSGILSKSSRVSSENPLASNISSRDGKSVYRRMKGDGRRSSSGT